MKTDITLNKMHQVNIIIADDHQIFREGLKMLIRSDDSIRIIAEAENGEQLIRLVDKLKPDLVVTDIRMPVMDGIEAARQLQNSHPTLPVIALTMFMDDEVILKTLDAGVKGYLLKNIDKEQLHTAIKQVHAGGHYFQQEVAANFARLLALSRENRNKPVDKLDFSERELKIIELTCKEFTNKEISSKLNLSTRTVEATKDRLQTRIGSKNMVGVIMYAIRNNLIELND